MAVMKAEWPLLRNAVFDNVRAMVNKIMAMIFFLAVGNKYYN